MPYGKFAFCGGSEFYNATRVSRKGVLGNECFIDGFSFLPHVLLFFGVIPVLISWRKSQDAALHAVTWIHFPLHNARWILALILCLVYVAEILEGVLSDSLTPGVYLHMYIPQCIALVGTATSVFYYHNVEVWNSPRFLLLLLLYWPFVFATRLMKLIYLMDHGLDNTVVIVILMRVSLTLYILLTLLELFVLLKLRYICKKGVRLMPPEGLAETRYIQNYVSFLSKAVFFWLHHLLRKGFRRIVDEEDLGKLPPQEESIRSLHEFCTALHHEMKQRGGRVTTQSLWRCYWHVHWRLMTFAGALKLCADILCFAGPFCISHIIVYVERSSVTVPDQEEIDANITQLIRHKHIDLSSYATNGYVLALLLLLLLLLQSTLSQTHSLLVIRQGLKLRSSLQALTCTKALKLSQWGQEVDGEKTLPVGAGRPSSETRASTSHGPSPGPGLTNHQLTNLVSVDANNLLLLFYIIHHVFTGPLKVLGCLSLLFYWLGPSALCGGLLLLLLAPLQYLLSHALAKLHTQVQKASNERVRACGQLLQSIKLLKLYAWEPVFSEQIQKSRRTQLGILIKMAALRAVSANCYHMIDILISHGLHRPDEHCALGTLVYNVTAYKTVKATVLITEGAPALAMLVTFCLHHHLRDAPFKASEAIPALVLFDMISQVVVLCPLAVNFLTNSRASTKRFQTFLSAPEVQGYLTEDSDLQIAKDPKLPRVEFHLGEDSEPKVSFQEVSSEFATTPFTSPPKSLASTPSGSPPLNASRRGTLEPSSNMKALRESEEEKEKPVGSDGAEAEVEHKVKRKHKKATKSENNTDSSGSDSEDCQQGLLAKKAGTQDGTLEREQNALLHAMKKQRRVGRVEAGGGGGVKEQPKPRKRRISKPDKPPSRAYSRQTSRESSDIESSSKSNPDKQRNKAKPAKKHSTGKKPTTDVSQPRSRKTSQSSMDSGAHGRYDRHISSATMDSVKEDDEMDPSRGVGVAVEIQNGCFSWGAQLGSADPVLKDVNFKAESGELTMIIGPFGSGKTSLVAAMLGEMYKTSGTVTWKPGATLSYAGQDPWLLSASVQENIMFGRPLEMERYKRVLHACGLLPDINILPSRDQSIIGEKGLHLNPGQQQRVSLARAMYARTEIVILDEPLTFLDFRMASHIFEEGILKLLLKRKRTVVMVTHQLPFLSFAQQIFRMEAGQIEPCGNMHVVRKSDPPLYVCWKAAVRQARLRIESESEEGSSTNLERKLLLRNISTRDFQRQLRQSFSSSGENSTGCKHGFIGHHVSHVALQDSGATTRHNLSTSAAAAEKTPRTPQAKGGQENKEDSPEQGEEKEMLVTGTDFQELQDTTAYSDPAPGGASGVSVRVLWGYTRACTIVLVTLALLLHVSRTAIVMATDIVLTYWANAAVSKNQTGTINLERYLRGYTILGCSVILLSALVAFTFELTGLRASSILHSSLLRHIINAPMRFFDRTPVSQILQTLSSDVQVIDDHLPSSMEYFFRTSLVCLSALCMNIVATRFFVIPAVSVVVVYGFLLHFFRKSARQLQRLDSSSRPAVLSHILDALTGRATIRAFRKEKQYQEETMAHIDSNTTAYLWLNTANRWLGIRLEYLGAFVVFCAAVSTITVGRNNEITPAMAGLCIAYTLMMCGYLNSVVRSVAEVEMQLGCVDRLLHYTSLTTETSSHKQDDVQVPEHWPIKGEISFQKVALSYADNEDSVVENFNIHIKGKQKVGLCGPVGSSKTSIAMSLLRLININQGQICIDGINIQHIPLSVLRSKVTLVTQDPIVFSGTIRFNLDPQGQRSDNELWDVLELTRLKCTIKNLPCGLDSHLKKDWKKIDGKMRQLLCLARGLLRNSRVLILDEVNSPDDVSSENIIRDIISQHLKDVTVIRTVMQPASVTDLDYVVMLEKGRIAEEGSPEILLAREDSLLSVMLKQHK